MAYAVADKLGFTKDQVKWTVVPFNSSYAPGDKAFDFDINQISITPKRQKVVDFSDGYYTVNQAVVALKDSPIAGATSVAELARAKLGAQVGTTSLDFITNTIKPAEQPFVYNDTNDAKSALQNGQIDGIVVDLPDRVLHHRGRDRQQQDRRPVQGAGGWRAVRPAVPEGQPAGDLREQGTRRAHGLR